VTNVNVRLGEKKKRGKTLPFVGGRDEKRGDTPPGTLRLGREKGEGHFERKGERKKVPVCLPRHVLERGGREGSFFFYPEEGGRVTERTFGNGG